MRRRFRVLLGVLFAVCLVALPKAWANWVDTAQPGITSVELPGDPGPLAVSKAGSILAVGLREGHAVAFMDPESGIETRRFALPGEPIALALTGAGDRAYVLVEGQRKVFVLDAGTGLAGAAAGSSGKPLHQWGVEADPVALALAPGEQELIIAGRSGRLLGLRTADGRRLRDKDLKLTPEVMANGVSGLRLLLAGEESLVSLDAASWTQVNRSALGGHIAGLAWWSSGGLALALTRGEQGLVVLDPDTGQVDAQNPLAAPFNALAVDEDRGRAFAAVKDDEAIHLYQLHDRTWAGHYLLPERARRIVFDSARGVLYASSARGVLRLQPDDAVLQQGVELGERPRDLAVDNVAHQAVVAGEGSRILYRVSLGGDTDHALALSARPYRVAVDSGRHLAVVAVRGKEHRLIFADLAGAQPRLLAETIRLHSPVAALAVDASRGLTLVASERGELLLLDNHARKLIATAKGLPRYRSAAVDSLTGLVYLAREDKKGYSRYDLGKKAIKDHWPLAFKPGVVAIDEALRLAVFSEQDTASLHLFDLEQRAFTGQREVPERPVAIAIQPETHVAAVASRAADTVTLLDLKTQSALDTAYFLERPFALAVSTRFNQILALSEASDDLIVLQLPNPVPVLGEIRPTNAQRGSAGIQLTAAGEGFVEDSTVHFGDRALDTRWVSGQELSAEVPGALLAEGVATAVTVVNPEPDGGRSEPRGFEVLNPAPVLATVSPASLVAKAGSGQLTLNGDGFLPESEVYFGAHLVAATFVDPTRLVTTVPVRLLEQSGSVPVTVFNRAPGGGLSLAFAVKVVGESPTIHGFTPASGAVGTLVNIDGTNFDALNPGANVVRFAGERATVSRATATRLSVIVPIKAVTGKVTVTTQRGSVSSAEDFTVRRNQDFRISLDPAMVQVPPGGSGTLQVSLQSVGLAAYAHAATLAVTGLPAGVTARLDRAGVAATQPALLTLSADPGVAAGRHVLTVTARGAGEAGVLVRSQSTTLEVLVAGATSVSGRVLHAEDDSPFVGARIRLGGQTAFTDATGSYRFANPAALGDQVILVDGHPANSADAVYPSAIAVPVMILAGRDSVALTSYIQAVKPDDYTAIVPGQSAEVTHPELPGYALRIPEGAVLHGWDGTPVTRINVRTVAVDRLPIRPLPPGVNTRTVYLYYFYREGGANPTQPIPVTMANDFGALPGEKADLWYYDESATPDPASNQWRIMGQGTVSADGLSIVSDPGVGIPKFCCGASFASPAPPPVPPGGDDCGPESPNPVDYASGIAQVFDDHSLGLNGLFPVRVSCHYSSRADRIGPFGRGTYLNLEWQLATAGESVTLISPAGIRYTLRREPDGAYRMAFGRRGGLGLEARQQAGRFTLRWPDGRLYEFESFGGGNQGLTAQTDPNGNRTVILRDATGRVQSVTDPNGDRFQLHYTGNLVTRLAAPEGRGLDFVYDGASRLARVTDHGGRVTQYEWDGNDRIIAKTNASGAVTRYEYEADGRAIRETFADGGVYEMDYLVSGGQVMETRVTDPEGRVTRYRFNGQGYLTRTVDALGRITTRTIDASRNLVLGETDPAGRTTRFTYDARGNVTSVRNVLGDVTLIEYDPLSDKPTRITDALGHETTYSYDAKGNLTAVTNAEGETTRLGYTSRGQVETVTDPLGNVTRFGYDARGNLTSVTDPLGQVVARQHHDAGDRLIEAIDALGASTRYTYDSLDRLSAITDALSGVTTLALDEADNLVALTDALGHPVERNVYDLRNRLVERSDALGAKETYVYDKVGNLVAATDRLGRVTTYAYDALDRRVRMADPDGRVTSYEYDLAGNISRISDSQSGDLLLEYDALDRLTRVLSDQGSVAYEYDAVGNRTRRLLNGTEVTEYHYDRVGRLHEVHHAGKVVRYGYDAAGRTIRKNLPNGITQANAWDAAGRLTGILSARADGTLLDRVNYAYDAAGNRIARTGNQASAEETAFTATYDRGNRLTTFTLTATGDTYDLEYQATGHLARKTRRADGATTRYTWDARGRLAGIEGPNGTAQFKYDALGRRIEKTVNGQTARYLYDGLQVIAEWSDTGAATIYLTGLGLDEALARYTQAGERTQLTDALGSVVMETDANAEITAQYAYSPYGEVVQTGGAENPVQYTARENDGTGLYYYRARYYDPQVKRFVSEDPIGVAGGVNPHSYVGGNPISYGDPTGLFVGSGLSRLLGRLPGRTPEETAYGGKLLDVGIGAVAGDVTNCIGGTDIGTPRDLLRGFGGVQAMGLSTATTYGLYGAGATISSAGATVALPLILAGYGGVEVGRSFNSLYERYRGNSLGSDLYDLVSEGRLFNRPAQAPCGCSN